MLLTKQLYLFCLNRPTVSILRYIGKPPTAATTLCARKFSSKKPNDRNNVKSKTKTNKCVNAQNEFVTYQLNTSYAAHLKRQQKLLNQLQKDEQDEEEKRKQRKPFQQNSFKVRDDNYGHGHKTGHTGVNRKEKRTMSDESSSNRFHRKSNYRKHQIDNDHDDILSESDSDDYSVEKLESPNWGDKKFHQIHKDAYKPSDKTQNRNAEEVNAFRTKMQIKIDADAPKPVLGFNELNGLTETVLGTLEKERFVECTPVQAQGIPIVLTGANMLSIAQSGSGKMLAMILSAVVQILNQDQTSIENGPSAVILAPTKELAEEIRQLAHVICESANIKYTLFTKNRIEAFTSYALLITTADHLYEILRKKLLSLPNCAYFALYDVDKMIGMCMEEEIVQIVSQIRCECQRLMWSTSWNGDVREMAMNILNDFVRMDIGTTVPQIHIAQNTKQIIRVSDEKSKKDVLNEVIGLITAQSGDQKSLIFVETPANADKINSWLRKSGYNCMPLHNGKSKLKRHETLLAFENGKFGFLVLTDTAAKNLQFTNISNVIHFDMPNSIVDYTHRVNRTGRKLNEIGTSYGIVTEDDGHLADDLIEILQQTNQEVSPALLIMKAANADSDDEISFAIPSGNGFKTYTIDNSEK